MANPPRKTTPKPKAAAKPAKNKYVRTAAVKSVSTPAKATSTGATPSETLPEVMKKKELVDRVVLQSGMKKKDVKPVVEAMLEVMGKSLAAGEEMNIQPFGKVMIKRTKEMENARMIVCRIRQRKEIANPSVVKLAQKTS